MAVIPTVITDRLAIGSFLHINEMAGWETVCVAAAEGANLNCCHIPLIDGKGNNEDSIIKAINAIHSYWREGKKVFVCCRWGMSRSVSVAAAAMTLSGETEWFSNALGKIMDKRKVASPRDDTMHEVLLVVNKAKGFK